MEVQKRSLQKKFNGWYLQQISDELQPGKSLEETNVKFHFLILKLLHVVDFYNYITSAEGKEVVLNGGKATGIYDALNLGSSKLPNIDHFHEIDPLLVHNAIHDETNLDAVVCYTKNCLIRTTPKTKQMEMTKIKKIHGNL